MLRMAASLVARLFQSQQTWLRPGILEQESMGNEPSCS